jgi:hypothetical protein
MNCHNITVDLGGKKGIIIEKLLTGTFRFHYKKTCLKIKRFVRDSFSARETGSKNRLFYIMDTSHGKNMRTVDKDKVSGRCD